MYTILSQPTISLNTSVYRSITVWEDTLGIDDVTTYAATYVLLASSSFTGIHTFNEAVQIGSGAVVSYWIVLDSQVYLH